MKSRVRKKNEKHICVVIIHHNCSKLKAIKVKLKSSDACALLFRQGSSFIVRGKYSLLMIIQM